MTTSIAIIDYGMGNLHSVASAFAHVSPQSHVMVTADPEVIGNADRVLFPGVGAIRDCMSEIRRLGLDTLVPRLIAEGKPMLAICVGMQALMHASEESGGVDCINVLPGEVKFFTENVVDSHGQKLKVPHMGWNNVQQAIEHPLWRGIEDNSRFYFVHSYFVQAEKQSQVAGTCDYQRSFAAALAQDNLFATQFHPEKSDTVGLQLLKNFVIWNGAL